MSGFDNEILTATNVDFTSQSPVVAQITSDGQFLIGATASPNIRAGSLTSNDGSITFTYSEPTSTTNALDLSVTPNGAITSVLTANATPQFALVGSTSTVDFGLTNLVLGSDLPSVTTGNNNLGLGNNALDSLTEGNFNTAIGESAGSSITTASNNTAVGYNALLSATDIQCNNNTAIGFQALRDCVDNDNVAIGLNAMLVCTTSEENVGVGWASMIDLTTGDQNVAVGHSSLGNITTGSGNTAIGHGAGSSLTSSDSSNIIIGGGGTSGDNNTIRIGAQGSGNKQQDKAFMAGITGVTVAASEPMAIASTGQMSGLGFGTADQVLTSNGAGVSPSWDSTLNVTSVSFDAGANTLSSYEEGTWTPTFVRTGLTFTQGTTVGRYIRVGNLVTVWLRITLTNVTGSGSGDLTISGLPFTSSNIASLSYFGVLWQNVTTLASPGQWTLFANNNTSSALVGAVNTSTGALTTALTPATTANAFGYLTYRTG